jgi:predicted metal-dependent peptidase
VVDCIQENGWAPACAIFLTDGATAVTRPEPDFPVLWCLSAGGSDRGLPWGRTVRMER